MHFAGWESGFMSGNSIDLRSDRFALISLAISDLLTIDVITEFKLFIIIKKVKLPLCLTN
jgi:hypothetical protein